MTSSELSLPLSPTSSRPHELLFGDLPQEIAATRQVLEAIPDGYDDWVPHPKSTPLAHLATHVAQLPRFARTILTSEELDFVTSPYDPPDVKSTAERVAYFDARAAEMQAALAGADWDALNAPWTRRAGEYVILHDRKALLIRRYAISHIAHHRAQLGTYLRLLGRPLPGVYGPSADEM